MRSKWIRYVAAGLGALLLLIVGGLAVAIGLSSPAPLPRLAAGDTLPGFANWNLAELPDVQRVSARDGAPLTYRLYSGRRDRVVVLIHGSSGSSFSMHKLAQSLQAVGATVYSVSLRGHGGSGSVNGDTSYRGQLDDDLVDFVKATGEKVHRSLIGFSAGGGLVLRTAAGPNRTLFDAYLAISPFIAHDSPTSRPAGGGWTSVAVPRVVALSILDSIGLPWFQGLPVVRFATAAKADDNRTPVYSYRLLTGMQLSPDWRKQIARIDRPTMVVVGSNDELFLVDRFQPLFAELNPAIRVSIQPGFGHMNMIADGKACAAVATLWRQLVGL